MAGTRYTLETEEVGSGGFGKIRKGHDNELDRTVAVKVFDPQFEITPEEVERFKREARTLAQLSHPHIPSVYDVLFNDERLEIIFEFVEGRNLRDILEDGDAISLSECRLWFDQISSAVEHAHEHDILHRDIKPENIIISPDRRHCYLVDFGIALSKEELDRLTGSAWIGTPGYMSPEQESGESDLDDSDDVYALGVCLYEVLSGHRVLQGGYEPLHETNDLIPLEIDVLVKRCIEKKPRRLSSASDFRRLLGQALYKHRSISEVLTAGQLHELSSAIGQLTPVQFGDMKVGQRLLILQKCEDLVASDERRLDAARNEMLAMLVRVGVMLKPEEYGRIINPAIVHAYGEIDESGELRHGIRQIQDSIHEAASAVTNGNHGVIAEALLKRLSSIEFEKQKVWMYHTIRLVLSSLLANQDCDDEDAGSLAKILSEINEQHRQKVSGTEAEAEPDTAQPALS